MLLGCISFGRPHFPCSARDVRDAHGVAHPHTRYPRSVRDLPRVLHRHAVFISPSCPRLHRGALHIHLSPVQERKILYYQTSQNSHNLSCDSFDVHEFYSRLLLPVQHERFRVRPQAGGQPGRCHQFLRGVEHVYRDVRLPAGAPQRPAAKHPSDSRDAQTVAGGDAQTAREAAEDVGHHRDAAGRVVLPDRDHPPSDHSVRLVFRVSHGGADGQGLDGAARPHVEALLHVHVRADRHQGVRHDPLCNQHLDLPNNGQDVPKRAQETAMQQRVHQDGDEDAKDRIFQLEEHPKNEFPRELAVGVRQRQSR